MATKNAKSTKSAKLEIARVLVVSTAHMTAEENAYFGERGARGARSPVMMGEYGYLVSVAGADLLKVEMESENTDPSPGLVGIFALAKKRCAHYILFDRDADTVDGIEAYDW